jgi:hypothetical protein
VTLSAEDGGPPVGARRHHLVAVPAQGPGGAHRGQQVEVGLVFGEHHRSGRQSGDPPADARADRVVVGVALGHQPGAPPAGQFAGAPPQRGQADRGPAQPVPEPPDGPWPGCGQQRGDPRGEGCSAQPGSPRAGPVGQSADAVAVVAVQPAAHGGRVVVEQVGDLGRGHAGGGQHDHDQTGGGAPRAVQQGHDLGSGGGGSVGEHVGGAHNGDDLAGLLWWLSLPMVNSRQGRVV